MFCGTQLVPSSAGRGPGPSFHALPRASAGLSCHLGLGLISPTDWAEAKGGPCAPAKMKRPLLLGWKSTGPREPSQASRKGGGM